HAQTQAVRDRVVFTTAAPDVQQQLPGPKPGPEPSGGDVVLPPRIRIARAQEMILRFVLDVLTDVVVGHRQRHRAVRMVSEPAFHWPTRDCDTSFGFAAARAACVARLTERVRAAIPIARAGPPVDRTGAAGMRRDRAADQRAVAGAFRGTRARGAGARACRTR